MRVVTPEFLNSESLTYPLATITLNSGDTIVLDNPDKFQISGNEVNCSATALSFPIGECVGVSITLALWNDDEAYKNISFLNAKINLKAKKQVGNSYETIDIGDYTVITPEEYGATVYIVAVDDSYKLDKVFTYSDNLTLSNAVIQACTQCSVSYVASDLNFTNHEKLLPEPASTVTCRQVIQFCALMACGNATFRANQLRILPWQILTTTNMLADENSYILLDENNDILIEDWYSPSNINITSLNFYTDPIVSRESVTITGLSVTIGENTITIGDDAYRLLIASPFLQDEDIVTEYLPLIPFTNISVFTPFDAQTFSDIRFEFMDGVAFTDRKGNKYFSYITNVTYVFDGVTTISCSAENAPVVDNEYSSQSNTVLSALAKARELVVEEATQRETEIGRVNNALANASGLYFTTEADPDNVGAYIYYYHNKTRLQDSNLVWKFTANVVAVYNNGVTHDPVITLDVSGTAILEKIYAITLDATYIKAGRLSSQDGKNYFDLDTGEAHFGSIQSAIDDISSTLNTYFDFNPTEGLIIGNSNNAAIKLRLQNDNLAFIDNSGKILAQMSNTQLYISSARINTLQIGTDAEAIWEITYDHGFTIRRTR